MKNKIFLILKYFKFFLLFFTFLIMILANFIILKKIKNVKNKEVINFNNKILLQKIKKIFSKYKKVNINEVEATIYNGRKWEKNRNKTNEINIGIQMDPNYVTRVMMTLASIIDSQKNETKLRFHFAVVLLFKAELMLKIYSLREKIRDDVEFSFYDAKRVETELKNLNLKGPGAVAKLLLPQLLPNDIDRIIIFDTGDLIVLRDLTEMYNWNMSNYLYLGQPG